MKTRLTFTLTVLTLVAAVAFNEFITNRTSAQDVRATQEKSKSDQAAPQPEQLVLSGLSAKGLGATCFCKVLANGTEVAKPNKGGYVQPIQAEACRNYCRGLWDSSPGQRVAWAKLLPNACGNVSLRMDAALGTMSYQTVRSGTETGINGTQFVTTCTCPSGQNVSNAFAGSKYCIPPTGIAVNLPDQLLQGGALIQGHVLYQIIGSASCITKCQ
jgi:hypothetical protein